MEFLITYQDCHPLTLRLSAYLITPSITSTPQSRKGIQESINQSNFEVTAEGVHIQYKNVMLRVKKTFFTAMQKS